MTSLKLFMIGTFACLGIFLFATAPSELPSTNSTNEAHSDVNVAVLFNIANSLNEAARLVFTKNIVGEGKKVGIDFGEDWDNPDVEKGPLPALFLRLVARQMERKPQPLGSDEPINKSNLFTDEQMVQFSAVKRTLKAQVSIVNPSRAMAMYPDFASAKPCVECHNEHQDSPKTDWKLGDVMGATTWTFPSHTISESTLLTTSRSLMESVAEAYQKYLDKTRTFKNPIAIGQDWPGPSTRSLPDVKTFMDAVLAKAAIAVSTELLAIE